MDGVLVENSVVENWHAKCSMSGLGVSGCNRSGRSRSLSLSLSHLEKRYHIEEPQLVADYAEDIFCTLFREE